MKKESNIDELLNSYIDGELEPQEQVRIEHLVAENPQIANKLQQLRKCKFLVSSLPADKAPIRVLENIKRSLEVSKTSGSQYQTQERQTDTKFIRIRKVFAAAAVVAFAAVLSVVISNISTTPDREDYGVERTVSRAEFKGTLELKTSEFAAVDSVLNRSFKNNDIMNSFTSEKEPNRRVYSLTCSSESLDRVLNDLGGVWGKLSSTKLSVSTEVFNGNINIDAVTPKQIAEIARQTDSNKIIDVSKDYAVLNNMNEYLPSRGILPSIEDGMSDLIPPIPIFTRNIIDKTTSGEEGEKTVNLTIILSR